MSALPNVTLIVAADRELGIGLDNRLPWHLRKDLLRFKARTLGHPIVMGRKTWESLGRPLPGRRNIVISRNPEYRADGAEVAGSIEEARSLACDSDTLYVIGGAQIYAASLPLANRLLITEVDALVPADVRFPAWNREEFIECSREHHEADADNDHAFDFVEYHRVATDRRNPHST